MPFVPTDQFYLRTPLHDLIIFWKCTTNPYSKQFADHLCAKDAQGKILGTNQSVGSLARVVGPAVGGAVYGMHFTYPYVLAGSITLVVSVLAFRLRKKCTRSELFFE